MHGDTKWGKSASAHSGRRSFAQPDSTTLQIYHLRKILWGGGRVMRPCLTFRPHYFLDRHGRAPLTVTLENLQAANLLRITSLLVRIIEGHHLVIQSMYLTY